MPQFETGRELTGLDIDPARSKRLAIGVPIPPSPKNPIFAIFVTSEFRGIDARGAGFPLAPLALYGRRSTCLVGTCPDPRPNPTDILRIPTWRLAVKTESWSRIVRHAKSHRTDTVDPRSRIGWRLAVNVAFLSTCAILEF